MHNYNFNFKLLLNCLHEKQFNVIANPNTNRIYAVFILNLLLINFKNKI